MAGAPRCSRQIAWRRGGGRVHPDARLAAGDARRDRVGGGQRLRARGRKSSAKGAGAALEGRIARQCSLGVATGEVYRAGVAGDNVAVGVPGGDRELVSLARGGRREEAGHAKCAG